MPSTAQNNEFIMYPSTVSLDRQIELYRESPAFQTRPSVTFKGTVKLHGTNTAVVLRRDRGAGGPIRAQVQSRNRIITHQEDHLDFVKWVTAHLPALKRLCFGYVDGEAASPAERQSLPQPQPLFSDAEEVMVAGEWAGRGIQKKVGISELPRFWCVFAVRVDGLWTRDDIVARVKIPEVRMFNVQDFANWTVTIDFSKDNSEDDGGGGEADSASLMAKEINALTLDIERECPAALAIGGVKGVGEGIVWTEVMNTDVIGLAKPLKFKTKGPQHRIVGSKPNLQKMPLGADKQKAIFDFVDYAVTDARLDQGFDYLREMKILLKVQSVPRYMQWILDDVVKEEGNVLLEMGLSEKDVRYEIGRRSKARFMREIGE